MPAVFHIRSIEKKQSGETARIRGSNAGTLFFEIARIISEKRPAAFVLENVKNLISHDRGRTLETIYDTLESELLVRL